MKRLLGLCGVLAFAVVTFGCGGGAQQQSMNIPGSLESEPDLVTVQHVLIAFDGTVNGVTRSRADAEALAKELFQRARSGEDFDALMEEYTDDRGSGVYGIANHGQEADETRSIFPRDKMAKCFGDVAFSLDVGEVGLASYDDKDCRFGWHIIKRIR